MERAAGRLDVVEEQVTYVNAPLFAEQRGLEVALTTEVESPDYRNLISVRGAMGLMRASRVFAALNGRHYVTPDDVKALAVPVLAHRLVLDAEAEFDGVSANAVVSQLLVETPPPADRVSS